MTPAQQDFEKISTHLKTNASAPWTWLFYGDSITHGAAHTHGFRAFPEIFAERREFRHSQIIYKHQFAFYQQHCEGKPR